MRRFILTVVSISLSASLWAAAFEGTVDYEIKGSDGKTHAMQYQIKSPRLRMNVERAGKKSSVIYIPPDKTMLILMDEKKMAIKQTIPDASTIAKPKTAAVKKPEFTNTGRKETIAGRECTVYSYKSDESEGEVCNAESMGAFYERSDSSSFWANEARSKGLFPLRTVNKDLGSGKSMTMVAKRIEQKSLPDSLFKVPADYKLMEGTATPGAELTKKMMNATPEERQKMVERMRKQYGAK